MRYLKATFIIGSISLVVVGLLYAAGLLVNTPDIILRHAYHFNGVRVATPPLGLRLFLVAFLAYAFAWTTVDITRPILKSVVAVCMMFLILVGSWVLSLYGVFFSPFTAFAAVFVSFVAGMIYSRTNSGARKKILERLFGRRLSRAVFSRLVNSNIPMDFPGALQEGTVIVVEVHNHNELMELLSPQDYAAMTNLYLRLASDYLVEVGGYLDECGGESLRVVYGAPLPDEDHAVKACRAALDLVQRLDNLNKECDSRWQRRFDFRIGINSGQMIAAAYGGDRVGSFSVAGPAVEFARRLCAACAMYGCRILLGAETFERAGEFFEVRPIEVLKVKGTKRRVELYEALSLKHAMSPERERSRDHFWRGVIYFREKQWDKAVDEFSKARITGIPDSVLDYYIGRVERSRRGSDEESQKEQSLLFDIA